MLHSLLLLVFASAILPAAESPLQVDSGSIAWKAAPASMPPGTKIAILEGDPNAEGIFTLRLLVPAGARVGSHWHPRHERVTLLSGAVEVTFEDDPALPKQFDSGDFYVNPPRARHSLFFPVETILQLTGVGPWEVVPTPPAKRGKARGEVRIVSVSPPEGTIVGEENEIVIEVEYAVEPFEAETFLLLAQFDTTTPGRTVSIRRTIEGGSLIPTPPRDELIEQASGREIIRLPLREMLPRADVAKPLRIRVLLNEMISDVRSRPINQTRVIEFPVDR